jgi:hypothetical protein
MLAATLGTTSFGYDPTVEWDLAQRIGSRNYFARYFQYAVPPGDVADQAIADLVTLLNVGNTDEATVMFRTLASSDAVSRFIEKLRRGEESLSAAAARTLVEVIVRCSSVFPHRSGVLAQWFSPDAQAAVLFARALRYLPAAERDSVTIDAMRRAEPLLFALGLHRFLRTPEDEQSETGLRISEEAEGEVRLVLAQRLREEERVMPFYNRPRPEGGTLLFAWSRHCGKEETSRILGAQLEDEPAAVFDFLRAVTPLGEDAMTDEPVPGDFDQEEYQSVAQMVDPARVAAALSTALGDIVPSWPLRNRVLGKEKEYLALRFRTLHQMTIDAAAAHDASPVAPGANVFGPRVTDSASDADAASS